METGSIPVISTKQRKGEETINIFSTSFVNDFFLHSIFVLALILLMGMLYLLKKSRSVATHANKTLVSFIALILTAGVSHLSSYFLDVSFFIFTSSICIIAYYVLFLDYYKKSWPHLLFTIFLALEISLWNNLAEVNWTTFFITSLSTRIVDSLLPVLTIFSIHLFKRYLKWHTTKISIIIGLYFIIGSIAYAAVLTTEQERINWVLSILLTTLLTAIILSATSVMNTFLTNMYWKVGDDLDFDLDRLINFQKAPQALRVFTRRNKITFAPFVLIQFPELYKTRKFSSYKNQKNNIFKYIRLIEKNIRLVAPNSKILFFEAGYHDIAFVFEMDNLNSEIIKKIMKEKSFDNIDECKQISTLFKLIDDITFNIKLPEENSFSAVNPRIGLSFYGYNGEVFQDLLFHASSNPKEIKQSELGVYNNKHQLSKLIYRAEYNKIKNTLESPLLDTGELDVLFEGKEIGSYLTINYADKGLLQYLTFLNDKSKATFYNTMMYRALTKATKQNETYFITLPISYFEVGFFDRQEFLKKIRDFEMIKKIKINVVLIGFFSDEALEGIRWLRTRGMHFSTQDGVDLNENFFEYTFEENAEVKVEKKLIAVKYKQNNNNPENLNEKLIEIGLKYNE